MLEPNVPLHHARGFPADSVPARSQSAELSGRMDPAGDLAGGFDRTIIATVYQRRSSVAFYNISEMQEKKSNVGPAVGKSVAGELIKVGITTYQEGEGPPPHVHPNEEQFMLVLEGRMRMIVGEEERVIGPGTLVHIPRNTRHGVCALDGPAVFFAAKSPVGTGDMAQDYNKAKDADEVWKRLSAQTA
jgi:quercetin dioxygenase-like cupin family protein